MEQFLLYIIYQIKIKQFHSDIERIVFCNAMEIWLFEQDLKNKILWVNYPIVWKILENYGMNYTEIQEFMTNMVEKYLKIKGFTPKSLSQLHHLR